MTVSRTPFNLTRIPRTHHAPRANAGSILDAQTRPSAVLRCRTSLLADNGIVRLDDDPRGAQYGWVSGPVPGWRVAPAPRAPPREAPQRERSGLLPGGGRRLALPGAKGEIRGVTKPCRSGQVGQQSSPDRRRHRHPLAVTLTGANRNDVTQLIPLLGSGALGTRYARAPPAPPRPRSRRQRLRPRQVPPP